MQINLQLKKIASLEVASLYSPTCCCSVSKAERANVGTIPMAARDGKGNAKLMMFSAVYQMIQF